jgi:hypothetical protein
MQIEEALHSLHGSYLRTIATLAANLGQLDAQIDLTAAASSRGCSRSSSAEAAAAANARRALEQVQQALHAYWAVLAGLLMEGRADLIPAFILSDVVSMM